MEQKPEDILLISINKALTYSEKGLTHKSQDLLKFIYYTSIEFPNLLWNSIEIWKLAKSFLILYHQDIFDDENTNIQIIQMSYVYNQRAIDLYKENPQPQYTEDYFHALHTQVVILSTCSDCFIHSISELYSKESMTAEELKIAQRLAYKILPIITYDALMAIDDTFPNFNNDLFLDEVCNKIELDNPDITDEQIIESKKIHTVMLHSFKSQFKTKK